MYFPAEPAKKTEMQPDSFANLKGRRRWILVFLTFWLVFLTVAVNVEMTNLQSKSEIPLPFGITSSHGEVLAQDFAYNVLFFKGVRDGLVKHPYRMEEQEEMMRQILPGMPTGMIHGYSPVAFILMLPLLGFPGQAIYLIYTTLCVIGIILLFKIYLLPRSEAPLQLLALTVCAVSVWLTSTFATGQSSIFTTTILGGFWCLLQRREKTSPLHVDLLIAVLFWMICLKPSVAIVPAMLLLGSRAWRVLVIGVALLIVTWIFCARYYGGCWGGVSDYLHLLNHYHSGDFTPYFRGAGGDAQAQYWSDLHFSIERNLILFVSLILVVLRWMRHLSGSEHFQGMVWVFLLLSPYLMPTENWVLCLLVVEGSFFQSNRGFLFYGKLLLLMGIFDLRLGLTSSMEVEYQLKWLLFLWMVFEWFHARMTQTLPKFNHASLS